MRPLPMGELESSMCCATVSQHGMQSHRQKRGIHASQTTCSLPIWYFLCISPNPMGEDPCCSLSWQRSVHAVQQTQSRHQAPLKQARNTTGKKKNARHQHAKPTPHLYQLPRPLDFARHVNSVSCSSFEHGYQQQACEGKRIKART